MLLSHSSTVFLLAAFKDSPFAYRSLGFVFSPLGLLSALLLFIRLTVSNNLKKWLINLHWLFRLSHFGTVIISFGTTRCLLSLLTSVMNICFWSYPLAKPGCWKWLRKFLFVSICLCDYFDWQALSVDVSANLFVKRDQVLPKQVAKRSSLAIAIMISMRKQMTIKRCNFCQKFKN